MIILEVEKLPFLTQKTSLTSKLLGIETQLSAIDSVHCYLQPSGHQEDHIICYCIPPPTSISVFTVFLLCNLFSTDTSNLSYRARLVMKNFFIYAIHTLHSHLLLFCHYLSFSVSFHVLVIIMSSYYGFFYSVLQVSDFPCLLSFP